MLGVEQAINQTIAGEWDPDLKQSFVVGDKATDIDMAHNAGAKGILVQTGYGAKILKGDYQHRVLPDYIAANEVKRL